MRFQFGTSKPGRSRRPYLPYAFTEHGVVPSSVLNSERARANEHRHRPRLHPAPGTASWQQGFCRLEATLDQHASAINILAKEINGMTERSPESEMYGGSKLGYDELLLRRMFSGDCGDDLVVGVASQFTAQKESA